MKNKTRSLRSRLSRRLRCVLVALVLAALLPLGSGPIAAQSPSEQWFQWGPAHTPSLDSLLSNPDVQQALYLAVNENAVSQQVLGEPSRLMFAGAAAVPQEFLVFDDSAAWKAQQILKDDGITEVKLTIAADPSVPEAPALAKAVAQQLRQNIGAEVTVVEGDADLLVARSLGMSPTAGPGDVSLETTCSPDTFRPNEWTVVECDSTVKNSGQADFIFDLVLLDGFYPVAGAVDYPLVSGERDGKPEIPMGRYAAAERLGGGETAHIRRLSLLRVAAEGEYRLSSRVMIGGELAA